MTNWDWSKLKATDILTQGLLEKKITLKKKKLKVNKIEIVTGKNMYVNFYIDNDKMFYLGPVPIASQGDLLIVDGLDIRVKVNLE
jgi:hypothetical protein